MNFIDLKGQFEKIENGIRAGLDDVFAHGKFIMGPEVKALEQKLAEYVGVNHCIGVSSGTDALQIAMMALDLKAGDEVIMPPFTYYATIEVAVLLGITPVFVEIDPKTYNIDPTKIEAAITDKTKAIVPVSLYGQCANFNEINKIAEKHDLFVIEDGAQSFGATHHGKKSCGLSTVGCTSFFPSKPLGCYGDGGACFTDDDELAEKMRSIRTHGQAERYTHVRLGVNGRLDTLQAAILLQKFAIFPKEVGLRQQVAKRYIDNLKDYVVVPHIEAENLSVYGQFTIQIDNRKQFRARLQEHNIPTAVHYPKALYQQPYMQSLGVDWGVFELSEQAAKKVVSLPFYPNMKQDDIDFVCQKVIEYK